MEFPTITQMNKIKGVIAMAGLLGGLALAGAPAFAQTAAPATPPTTSGSGMMEHGMPNSQGGKMMKPEMMQKMAKMMDGCNHRGIFHSDCCHHMTPTISRSNQTPMLRAERCPASRRQTETAMAALAISCSQNAKVVHSDPIRKPTTS